MIKCKNWILVERYKQEREQYEEYNKILSRTKIQFAQTKLKEIDIKILKLIHRMKIITSSQIAKIIFKDTKYPVRYCNNHLKKLFELGCIDRFFPLSKSGYPQTHVVLASIGARIIGIDNFKKIVELSSKWRHTLARSELFSIIYYRHSITEWKPELPLRWEDRSTIKMIQTDVFGGWINKNIEKFAMFEIDLGTERIKDLYLKVKNYHKYFNSTDFQKGSWQPYLDSDISIIPEVIFVLNDEKRSQKLQKFIREFNSNVSFSSNTFGELDSIIL